MDYKLAKELEDAGFPVKYHDVQYDIASGGKSSPVREIRPPTLPELIEACIKLQPSKYANFMLSHTFVEADGGSGYLWEAHFGDGEPYMASNDTPEEAVAKLYIALNNK